eukprot:132616_1
MTDSDNPDMTISIGDTEYNQIISPIIDDTDEGFDEKRVELMALIRSMSCGSTTSTVNTNLIGAINSAVTEFTDNRVAGREEKIAIFSSCADKTNSDQVPTDEDVCSSFGDGIFDDSTGDEIEVTVMNINSANSDIADR